MPRNMSFFHTTDQIRDRSKTVTRRLGWKFLKPGDLLHACVKCQGLGKGGKVVRLALIRVVSTRWEKLHAIRSGQAYADYETKAEGFPGMSGHEFVEMFCEHMNCKPFHYVNRIEFEYVEEAA